MYALARIVERLLQGLLFIGVIGAVICLVKMQWLGAVACIALAAAILFAFFHVRCPRCALPIGADTQGDRDWSRDRNAPADPTAGDCPGCGRTRDGVLPFQYLWRPEADG